MIVNRSIYSVKIATHTKTIQLDCVFKLFVKVIVAECVKNCVFVTFAVNPHLYSLVFGR